MSGKKTENSTGKVAVIYARYSSVNQRDVSIEQQVAACQKYAESQDLQVLRVYDDHAMTGTNDNRPSFQQMIHDSSIGAFSYVIVYSLDRFSRNKYDAVSNKKTLRDNGVKVLSATEHISDDPTGQLMESILEGFAQYYSDELSQKIKRGYRNNAEKCLALGSLPYGYKRGADGKYEIVPDEALIVQEIFQRVADRETMADIYRDLNQRGIKTRKDGAWNKNSLSKMIHNRKYLGIYEYHDTRNGYDDICIPDGIPRIIDDELFARVQEYCKTKPNSRGNPQKRRRENGVYLLTGKLFCGHCKGPMVGVSGTGKSGNLFFYYTCKTHRDKKTCSKKQVQRDETEKLIATKIQELMRQTDVIDWITDNVLSQLEEMNSHDETKLLRDRLAIIEKEKATILGNMTRITLDVLLQDMQQNYEKLTVEESSLKAKLLVAEVRKTNDISREHVLAFAETYANGDVNDKAYQETLIDTILVKAYLYDDRFKLIVNFTGNTQEVEVPIDVEGSVDIVEVQGLNAADSPAGSVRIESPELHHCCLIRTPFTVYVISGLAVVVGKLAS